MRLAASISSISPGVFNTTMSAPQTQCSQRVQHLRRHLGDGPIAVDPVQQSPRTVVADERLRLFPVDPQACPYDVLAVILTAPSQGAADQLPLRHLDQ